MRFDFGEAIARTFVALIGIGAYVYIVNLVTGWNTSAILVFSWAFFHGFLGGHYED